MRLKKTLLQTSAHQQICMTSLSPTTARPDWHYPRQAKCLISINTARPANGDKRKGSRQQRQRCPLCRKLTRNVLSFVCHHPLSASCRLPLTCAGGFLRGRAMVLSAGRCRCRGLGAAGNRCLLEVGERCYLWFGGCNCLALNEVFRGRDG